MFRDEEYHHANVNQHCEDDLEYKPQEPDDQHCKVNDKCDTDDNEINSLQLATVIDITSDTNDIKENKDKDWVSVIVDPIGCDVRTEASVNVYDSQQNNKSTMSSISVFFIALCLLLSSSVLLLVVLRTLGNKQFFKNFILPTME